MSETQSSAVDVASKEIYNELLNYVVSGLLACPCDNLSEATSTGKTAIERLSATAKTITIAIQNYLVLKQVVDLSVVKLAGTCAQGLLASPHDNLGKSRRGEKSKSKGINNSPYAFAQICVDMAEKLSK